MKKLLILTILLSIWSCDKPTESEDLDKTIYIYPTLDSVYDLELHNDTLYIANGESGIKILKILTDEGIVMDSLYEGGITFSQEEKITEIEFSSNSGLLFALDKLSFMNSLLYAINSSYLINEDFTTLSQLNCFQYQSKFLISEDTATPEILILHRNLNPFNEDDWSSAIQKVSFSPTGWGVESDCSYDLIVDLNYGVTDLDFAYDRLYVSNPNKDIPSIQVYNKNVDTFSLTFEDTLSMTPNTIRVYENSYVVGLNNEAGCYIALLDLNGEIVGKFNIAEGFTIQDIHYSNSLLVLSSGYGGVLVYDWTGDDSIPILRTIISSAYAYCSIVFDNNRIIVGTQNGIEVYEI